MKKAFILILGVLGALVGPVVLSAESQPQEKVIVYYFHGSFRCFTCTNMEKYSREAVETKFKDDLISGKIEFKAVNVEERGNEHFVNEYKLFTKSLVLSGVKDGKEVRSKNLQRIWELAGNREKFIAYVAFELADFMKEMK